MTIEKISIFDLILVIVKKKKFIIIFTLIMSIIAVAYSLLAPQKWTSSAVFVAINSDNTFSASSILEGFGLGSGGSSIQSTTYKYSAILKSRAFSEDVISKFDLINYLEIPKKDSLIALDVALKQLNGEIVNIYINDETYFIGIKVTTDDKKLSKDIVEYYLKKIEEYSLNSKNNTGRQKRAFLESRINDLSRCIKAYSDSVKTYQNKNNIVNLENQAKASVEQYGKILTDYYLIDIESDYLKKQYNNDNSKLVDINNKKDILKSTLKSLENGKNDFNYLLSLDKISNNAISIQEMLFTIELYKKVLETIYPQYELAKLEELDTMDKIEIIDYPSLAGLRTSPKRAMICVVTFLSSLLFSSLLVLIINSISEKQSNKIKSIWSTLIH